MEKKIRVLIAKPGLDGHDRGAKVIARALRDAGMEVIYTGLRQTPEMIASAALQEDVDAVGLSILSGAHMTLVPRVLEQLKSSGQDAVWVFVGGIIPEEDGQALKEMGVRAVYGPGTPTTQVVEDVRWRRLNKLEYMADRAEQVLRGDRLALSRLITEIENDSPGIHSVLDQLFPHTGKAHIIGVTGPSGSGKSTLVNRLALVLSSAESGKAPRQIGIIAVDPTSPFSGGALLGDRVRMRDLAGSPNIFIRSMASRGALGGIARAADNAAMVMDAAGFDIVIIETVGAGQSEVEIARWRIPQSLWRRRDWEMKFRRQKRAFLK